MVALPRAVATRLEAAYASFVMATIDPIATKMTIRICTRIQKGCTMRS